ncbi:chromodomain helicase DNA binding protein 1 [Magnaporthiopsis poae ATCC 64411]|uniref:Chromodomain helicase DNA binding protein 1 n=1 Tax=Magnaporthiopsis poae (strain ATCC 64411 / 73-15) TaxID=644358 RepID=A0A0C4E4Y5_MAGP6|nr:chromodomain helicase DNA binding protein 1 [Magnaporthiopsis poae ATCC 64411]
MSSSPAASEAEVSEVASSPSAESAVGRLAPATSDPPVLPSIELPNRNASNGGTADDAPHDPKHDSASRIGDKPADDGEDSSEGEDVGADAYKEEEDKEGGVDGWYPAARSKAAKGKEPVRKARGLEIRITPLPAHLRDGYKVAPRSTYVRSIVNEIEGARGEEWYQIEYDDGAVDQVSFDELVASENGLKALEHFQHPGDPIVDTMFGRPHKKRKHSHRDDSSDELRYDDFPDDDDDNEGDSDDMDLDDDDDVVRGSRRKSASSRKYPAAEVSSRRSSRRAAQSGSEPREHSQPTQRNLRPRVTLITNQNRAVDHDEDELAGESNARESEDDKDESFIPLVRSDINPKNPKRKRGRPARVTYRQASIEFEVRRSGRANKATKAMLDPADDDSFYVEDDKVPAAPKAVSIKEIFQPVDNVEFVDAHSKTCGTCGSSGTNHNKGMLIHCQGCSFSFHKVCLGYRGMRDHRVSKVGTDHFVLQCRFCIGLYYKKDCKAPRHDTCQECRTVGPACRGFTPKLTSKQEEKLRAANDGDDPITKVAAKLINNPENVLFRCTRCKRAFHYLHLPRLENSADEDPADKDKIRADRLTEYSMHHTCKDCLVHKNDEIQGLVAWRPVDHDSYQNESYSLISEDDKEYLVKWGQMSHAHCTWMPGAWIFGASHGTMRASFAKRDDGQPPPPRFTKEDAIPAEYLMADIIFAAKYHSGSDRVASKEDALARISKVKEVRVKFQGLSYDEVVWDSPPSRSNRPLWDAFKEAYEEYINGKLFNSVPPHIINQRIVKFCENPPPEIAEQPEALTPSRRLMKYQVEGVNWLVYHFYKMDSIILADEMGLGKTIQICGMIGYLALQQPKCWPFLIVVPSSTCPNWRREMKQWVPDLRVVCYFGGKVPQEIAYKNELFPDGSKDIKAHVVIMSYDSAQDPQTRHLFRHVRWQGLVVDEGQRLKNDQSLLYGALRAMKIPFRVLLTGTPLQNNKRELFNLIQFIDTSKIAAKMDEEYAELTNVNIRELHALIKPYFLRRTKADVLKFLPPMGQVIVPVSMSVVQEKLCKSIMAKNPQLIQAIFAKSKMSKTERGSLNNILMQLRKCLCHPFVYSDAIEDRDLDAKTMQAGLIEASSKLVLLNMMLPKLKENGHRVLIFSQFLDQLNILEDFLHGLGFQYRRLDGSVTSLERQHRIDEFNAPGSEIFAFLLSTRAGGVGINLATADTVIILDPDFNPHQDIQALSRAHRIGQTKKVLCFQLMTKGSVEEKIMQMGRKKMALDHVMIETMDKQDVESDDLESILKHGAEALFSEDNEKEIIKYDDASVEKLLDRSHLVAPELGEDDKREREFTLARVWVNDKGGLVDDLEVVEGAGVSENVWEKLLMEREMDAKRRAEKEAVVLGRGGRRRQAVQYSQHMQFDDEGPKSESEQDDDFVANEVSDDDEARIESDVQDAARRTGPQELDATLQWPPGSVGGAPSPQIPGSNAGYGQAAGPNGAVSLTAEAPATQPSHGVPGGVGVYGQTPGPNGVVPRPRGRPRGPARSKPQQGPQQGPQQVSQPISQAALAGIQINLSALPTFSQPTKRGRPPNQPRPAPGQAVYRLGNSIGLVPPMMNLAQPQQPVAVLRSNGVNTNIGPGASLGPGVVNPGVMPTHPQAPQTYMSQLPRCEQCFHHHNPAAGCPFNPSSEMSIRVAIDRLRTSDLAQDVATRENLKAKLREMKLASKKGT